MSDIDVIEQAAKEAIDSDIGRDSFMDKIGGPEPLLAIIRDAAFFRWYFRDEPHGEWLETYLDGRKTGWTLDQWRAAIREAMKEPQ
jgi:hypothetical protein